MLPKELSDAAILAYVKICLHGRALRLEKKWDFLLKRELLVLDEPYYDDEQSDTKVDKTLKTDESPIEEFVTKNKVILQNAMDRLTVKERNIIEQLFWKEKTVKQLCLELNVSKNSVLKMKRNAFQKIRRDLSVLYD